MAGDDIVAWLMYDMINIIELIIEKTSSQEVKDISMGLRAFEVIAREDYENLTE